MKLSVKYILLITGVTLLSGCTMISHNTPFANVENLGTVLRPGENLSITNKLGIVIVEYLAPTKRRIIWNGESRDISLSKSLYLNGIYTDGLRVKPSMGDIDGIRYIETTPNIRTDSGLNKYILLTVIP